MPAMIWIRPGHRRCGRLLRMGRGQMMGVSHNRGLDWVGASAALIEG